MESEYSGSVPISFHFFLPFLSPSPFLSPFLSITFEGVTAGCAAYNAWLDKLSLLERFNGRTFRVVPAGTDPVTVEEAGEGDARQERYRMPRPEFIGLVTETKPAYRWAA